MKVHIDIDCTPEEARSFLGLPDVAPMQEAVLDQVKTRMLEGLETMSPENVLSTWLPMSIKGWKDFMGSFKPGQKSDDSDD